MPMSWFDWLNPVKREFVPQEFTTTIKGEPVRGWRDWIGAILGNKKASYYADGFTDYVEVCRQNFVVQNAIGKIAKLLAHANFTSENENDKIVAKINNPNEKQSKQEFLKEFAVFIKSAGYTVIWKRWRSVGNWDSLELINLNPDCLNFTKQGNIKAEYDGKLENILKDDVIVFYDSVREKDNKGYSVLKPLRSQINNIADAQKAKGIQIEKSGTTIISAKVPTGGGMITERLSDPIMEMPADSNGNVPLTQKDVIEQKLNGRGLENRIIVSERGIDTTSLSAGLEGLDYDSKTESDKLAIYDALGVPVELTYLGKNATYDNKYVAELSLLQSEIMPLAENLVNSLNSEFEKYGKVDKVDFNHLESMSVIQKRIQETNTSLIAQVIDLKNAGLITEEIAKEMLKDILP